MKYTITFVLTICAAAILAQAPDMERMKRDIEVGENILASLLEEHTDGVKVYSSNLFFGRHSKVEGSYLEDFGVLFTIAPSQALGAIGWSDGRYVIGDGAIAITTPESKGRGSRAEVMVAGERDSLSRQMKFQTVVETFATDYAYLMRQLPSGEKIMIRYGGKPVSSGSFGVIAGAQTKNKFSAVIEKSDLDAYENDRLSKEQLLDRIKYTFEEEGKTPEDRDLTLLTSIFSRLYQSDLSDNEMFRLRGTPDYEQIEGLGAVIYLNVGSRFPMGKYFYNYNFNGVEIMGRRRDGVRIYVPQPETDEEAAMTVEEEADSREEDADDIDEAYLEYMEDLKRNIVEYGSIVKNLEKNEALIFRVNFFECHECEVMPKKAEITVQQPTLEAYRKGNMDLEWAVDQLKITTEN